MTTLRTELCSPAIPILSRQLWPKQVRSLSSLYFTQSPIYHWIPSSLFGGPGQRPIPPRSYFRLWNSRNSRTTLIIHRSVSFWATTRVEATLQLQIVVLLVSLHRCN